MIRLNIIIFVYIQISLDDSTLLEKQSTNSVRHKCWGSTLTFPAVEFQNSVKMIGFFFLVCPL